MKRSAGGSTATVARRAPLDWKSIHRRLDAVQTAMESGELLTPEETRMLLRTRAQMLARAPESGLDHRNAIEVVEFVLASEAYAVESRHVREVFPLNDFTPVPGMAPHVLGIVNVRGRILFVIDIKKFFGLPERGITDLNKIVILQSQDVEFGVLADQIIGIRTIALQELQAPLPTLTGIREHYLKGIGPDRTVVLDATRLLSDASLLAQEQES